MEARLVEVSDEQGKGVGLVILTYDVDNEGKVVISDPVLSADTIDHLRPHVANLIQAFEHPVLTEDELAVARDSDSFPEPERPVGEPDAVLAQPGPEEADHVDMVEPEPEDEPAPEEAPKGKRK